MERNDPHETNCAEQAAKEKLINWCSVWNCLAVESVIIHMLVIQCRFPAKAEKCAVFTKEK